MTLIGIVLYIKAAIALVVGIALPVERNTSTLLEATGRDGDYILGTTIDEFIVAALLFLVASAIMSGAKWAGSLRRFWSLSTLRSLVVDGHPIRRRPAPEGLGVLVLWALYGNDLSEAYFEGHP